MKKISLLFVLISLLLASCKNNPQNTIEKLEKKVINEDKTLNTEVATELVAAYIDYANNNAEAEVTPDYLFKALELAVNMHDADKSFDILSRMENNYAQNEKTPTAIFMVASLICEDVLGDYGRAKGMYEKIIQKYPDCEWAETAGQAIKNLGKTPEELIREFEMMNDSLAEQPA